MRNFSYSNNINVRLYSNGGDVFDLKIDHNLLYITDSLILKYIPEENIYYYCKILNSNPHNWEVSKKEYAVQLVKVEEHIEKAFVSVKVYFGNSRLGRTFTKIYSSNADQAEKYKYTLCLNSGYREKFVLKKLEDIPTGMAPHGFSKPAVFSNPRDTVEIIDYLDNTIFFLDEGWSQYLINGKSEENNYTGSSLFASCIHDYCYIKLYKNDNSSFAPSIKLLIMN